MTSCKTRECEIFNIHEGFDLPSLLGCLDNVFDVGGGFALDIVVTDVAVWLSFGSAVEAEFPKQQSIVSLENGLQNFENRQGGGFIGHDKNYYINHATKSDCFFGHDVVEVLPGDLSPVGRSPL